MLPWPSPNAASALPTPSSFGEDRKRRPADVGTTSRPASSRSSSVHERCVPLLRSEELPPRAGTGVVGPAQCGCAKHACCHFARDAASPCPHAWHTQTPHLQDVLHDACLPADPLSHCSHAAMPYSSQVHWDRARIARKVRGKKKNHTLGA